MRDEARPWTSRRQGRPLAVALAALLALGGCGAGEISGSPDRGGPIADAASSGAGATVPVGFGVVEKHRGVSWVAGRAPVDGADFASLVAANVTWIAQTPFGWQRDERSPELRLVTSGRVYWGETDEGLEVTELLARQHGIATMLKPHVWLTRPSDGAWRGEIGMDSEAEWALWFDAYRRFILHYAELAERLGMPAFCVGTELHRTVLERPDDWRRLIAEVRRVYSGKLTYAANWHREVEEVPFWDALDLIGVQGYFPLATAAVPTVEELEAAWRPHLATLETLAARHGRPVLFTEIGYVSRPGATAEPWLWPDRHRGEPSEPAGLTTQERAYEAFFRVFWDRPWVAGAYVWKWYPNLPAGGPAAVDFTPQGKPAEQVMARWYGRGSATRPESALEPGECPALEAELEPVRFLPGIVSTTDAIEHGAVATPDGGELWFTRAVGNWGEPVQRQTILVARRLADGSFGQAEPTPFSGNHLDDDPFPSPDGQWIYFASDRPSATKLGDGPDLWRVRRLAGGWEDPEHLAAVSSPGYEASPVVTADGDLWFSSTRDDGLGSGDLWRARSDGAGGFRLPENVGAPVNSDHGEWNLLVAPDASWILFEASGRPENVTRSGDLYLSEKEGAGWSAPVNLRCLNSPGSDLLPRFGPSGTLLFASSRELDGSETDVYTVGLRAVLACCADPGGPPAPP